MSSFKKVLLTGLFVWFSWLMVGVHSPLTQAQVAHKTSSSGAGLAATDSAALATSVSAQLKPNQVVPYSLSYTPGYSKQKKELLETFKAQIIAYQKAYKEFVLAKKQFNKLQTIESLNNAIEATRQAALRRNEVLFTYIEILHLELIQPHPSLDRDLRNKMVKLTESLLTELKNYHHQLEAIETRDDLYQALFAYDESFHKLVNISYFSRYMLKVDELYWLSQKLTAIRGQLPSQQRAITGDNKLKQLKFRRGLDEIDGQIKQVNESLDYIKTEIYQDKATDKDWYKHSIKELTKVYTASLRATNYIIELLNPTDSTKTNE